MNCSTCNSWKRTGTTTTGQCRLRAPVIGFVTLTEPVLINMPWFVKVLVFLGLMIPPYLLNAKPERCTSFPITEEDAGCGEWRKAKG